MTDDWLSIEAAVTLLIERNPDCDLPFHYPFKIGGTIIQRLQECVASSNRLLDSHKAADEHSRRICVRRMEHAEFVLTRAEQIRDDLVRESRVYLDGETSLLQWCTRENASEPAVGKQSLLAWAYKIYKIDVDGFHARREGRTPPASPRYTDQISTKEARRAYDRIRTSPEHLWRTYNESEKREQRFLDCRLMLEIYLDTVEPRWRAEIARQGSSTVEEVYSHGVVVPGKIGKIVKSETGLSVKSIETLVKRILESIMFESSTKDAISDRECKKAHQFILGTALGIAAHQKALTPSTPRNALKLDPEAILKLIESSIPESSVEHVRSALAEACEFLASHDQN